MKLTWSYSSLGLFQQCPRKYYHLRVVKDIVEPETTAILYGKEVHLALEEYIRDGKPVPPQFKEFTAIADMLKAIPGDKLCEYKMGLTKDIQACGFFDENVWFRGVADLVIVNGETARVIDYKTGKSSEYADVKQLELMALAIFKHFPKLVYFGIRPLLKMLNSSTQRQNPRNIFSPRSQPPLLASTPNEGNKLGILSDIK